MQDSVSVNGTEFPIVEELDSFGRSTGYAIKRGNTAMQTVAYGYDSLGRLNTASFLHGGVAKQFSFERLDGMELMQNIVCPNGIIKSYGYEAQRDLVTSINDKRGATNVVLRSYTYDELGRPTSRTYARQGTPRNDTFPHNDRSELITATMGNDSFSYDYDNVGNRKVSTEKGETTVYDSNELNQYTAENEFVPQFDADGNQTLVKTGTGIWAVTYNALNRPTCFIRTNEDDTVTTVTAAYDYMGRRVFKKEEENGVTTLHQRYIYRGYLQIAALDLTRSTLNDLWLITWDPTEPIATRPLAIQKDGTWYTYGLDLTKNVMEVYGATGYITTTYTYTPFGGVTANGSLVQAIQWSSEMLDAVTGLTYYNFRYYNANYGTWLLRDFIEKNKECLYNYCQNKATFSYDCLGLQFVLPSHSATGAPGVWTEDNYKSISDSNIYQSWALALSKLKKWLGNDFEETEKYYDNSYETKQVKNSVIGHDIMDFFENTKNGKVRYCEDWRAVENLSIPFPGRKTVENIFTLKIKKAFNHFVRFFSSLDNGIISFIGSSHADVQIRTVEIETKKNTFKHTILYIMLRL